jgi:hypothetical protein
MIDLSRWRQVTPSTSELFAEEGARVVAADVIRLPPFVGGVRTERLDEVDQTGVFLGMREVVPAMKQTGGGSGINIASIWGAAAGSGAHAYHAAKGAVRNMTKNAAIIYRPRPCYTCDHTARPREVHHQ